MPSETTKYFYEEIKLITEGIGKTDLTEKLIEAAKEQNLEKMKLISRQFKRDNLELWGRMSLFYEEYGEDKIKIFYETPTDDLYLYNTDDIIPINLVTFMALSEECLDEVDLFINWRELQIALENTSYKEIAEQMDMTAITDLNTLMEAYDGL